jgi:hypothetical protein
MVAGNHPDEMQKVGEENNVRPEWVKHLLRKLKDAEADEELNN